MDMRKNVICCGNIAFDLITTGGNSKGGMAFQARPGGSVLNTSMLLARLGLPVSMLSKTGTDFMGTSLLGVLRREKVGTRYIVQDKSIKTGVAIAHIDKKGDSSYLFYRPRGPETAFKKGQFPPSLFKKTSVFHTASAYSYNDYTFEDALRLMKRAKKGNVFTLYDPNWREGRIKNKRKTRSRIQKLLPYVDILKLSDTDATGITGAKTLSSALVRLGREAVITLGEKGSFFWNGKKKTCCPAFKVHVVDTIGAGDAFTAGLIYRYCLRGIKAFREERKETLVFASAVSAFVCKGRGATEGLRSLRQVQTFLK
ncbi:carbohydrate kinase family protein [Candidatus Omnitrophota bacterium]